VGHYSVGKAGLDSWARREIRLADKHSSKTFTPIIYCANGQLQCTVEWAKR
jgi:hypothetical protein